MILKQDSKKKKGYSLILIFFRYNYNLYNLFINENKFIQAYPTKLLKVYRARVM